MPMYAQAQFQYLQADARTVPWSSINRLALEGGLFPPAYRPVSEGEIAQLLEQIQTHAWESSSSALNDDQEFGRLNFLLNRYQHGDEGFLFHGCPCKEHPPHLRLSGRLVGGYSELGNPLPLEAGLSFAPGYNLFIEPAMDFAVGSFWSTLNFRMGGKVATGGVDFGWDEGHLDPLTWPRWPIPSGKQEVREARLKGGAWNGQITRALVGMQWGNWSLSAGWDQRRSGSGLTGNLNLDYQGRPFPAITARRTSPFQFRGFMTHLAPDQLLIRTGLLSERTIQWNDTYGRHTKVANPYFFQWLLGWNITSWFRTQFTHTVMATGRDASLWPDLLQINFPVIGTTWRETDSGPITDRIFAAQFEFRWRKAPWPLLPSHAGRLFWDYGGTDFLPSGPGGLIPQISIPASIVGIELFSPRWDIGLEYAELQHTKVLWYTNSGYSEGYSQEQTLMGHPLGGSGESITGLVRIRPPVWDIQGKLQGRMANWGMVGFTPGTGELQTLSLSFSRIPKRFSHTDNNIPSKFLWEITTEWTRESANPMGLLNNAGNDSEVQRDWWRLIFKMGI